MSGRKVLQRTFKLAQCRREGVIIDDIVVLLADCNLMLCLWVNNVNH